MKGPPVVDGYTAMHARPFTLVSYSEAHNNAQRTESGRCCASNGMEDATAAGGHMAILQALRRVVRQGRGGWM